MNAIPTIDLRTWHAGGPEAAALATRIDVALQRAGFLLVTGHGVDAGLRAEVRAAGADRHPETPAHGVEVPRPEPGDRLLRRSQVVAGHQRHRRPREHPLSAVGAAGEQSRGEGEVVVGGRDEPAPTSFERR